MVEVSKDSHEVIDSITLRLSVEAAKELAALLYGVSVNYPTSTFDEIATGIDGQLSDDTVDIYYADENGEFGPVANAGCGCGGEDDYNEYLQQQFDAGL